MPISSVSITDVRPTAGSVEVDWTAEGLIFSGTDTISGFVEVVSLGFDTDILASTEIDETQGQDTASYTYAVDVSDVPEGDYSVRVNWSDDEGNSGLASTDVSIPASDGGDNGGGDQPPEGDGLLLTDLGVTCSVSSFDASPGDTITVDTDVSGFAPPGTSYEVDVELYVNGGFIDSETVNVTVNGSTGAELAFVVPEVGDYTPEVELANLRKV